MSHSGWDTRVVAESVPKELTVVGLISEECVDNLKAEAAGMRRALERCRGYVSGVGNPHKEDVEKALSGDAGKEILREMGRLKDTIDLKDTALKSATFGIKASKIEIELIEHERDEARTDLDREQKKNLQERKDLTELYAANMEALKSQLAEVTRERDSLKDDRTAAMKSAALVSRERDDLRAKLVEVTKERDNYKALASSTEDVCRALVESTNIILSSQLETAQKELEATREELDIAHRDLDRENITQLKLQFETAQKELATLKNTMVPLAQYDVAQKELAEAKKPTNHSELARLAHERAIEVEKVNAELSDALRDAASHGNSNLRNRVAALLQRTMLGNGSRYVHRSEVSRAVEEEREACAKVVEDTCGCYTWCCSGSIAEAIRARGKG